MKSKVQIILVLSIAFLAPGVFAQKTAPEKPTVYLIGDSTVNNTGENFVGWGNVIGGFFDKSKVEVVNRARGGRSSRTFYTENLWQKVLDELKPGDYVLMQFGHNDGGAIDREKFRGSIRGTGEETRSITGADGKPEIVRTYGWYLRTFVEGAKAKGATAVILSPVPRNVWKNGKVERASENYGQWAREIAEGEKVFFIDLNEITALKYEKAGADKVGTEFFTEKDHTHTSAAGARVNAESVVEGIMRLKKLPLRKYLLKGK
jgi:lysophospholipase L1-like esterase